MTTPIIPEVSMVYFLKRPSNELVKIGTSKIIRIRMRQLAVELKEHVEFLGATEGSYVLEREIHTRFKAYKYKGEWFYLSREIMDFISTKCIHSLDDLGVQHTMCVKPYKHSVEQIENMDITSVPKSWKNPHTILSALLSIKRRKSQDVYELAVQEVFKTMHRDVLAFLETAGIKVGIEDK